MHAVALAHNFNIHLSKNDIERVQWNQDILNAQLRPSISLSASIPDFTKTSSPVVQPDGRIAFQSIRQANSAVGLSVQQVIPQTGGSLFLTSGLQRFDDLSSDITQYNGIPVRLGIFQPIFGFNPWKYNQRINDLSRDVAAIQFDVDVEETFTDITVLYFEVLIADADVSIARENESVNKRLLTIANERYRLGKISRDELLQLEIARDNASLDLRAATLRLENAERALYVIAGTEMPTDTHRYNLPAAPEEIVIDYDQLHEQLSRHRPEFKQFLLDKLQLDRDQARVKADFGFQANLSASVGLARGSDRLQDIYRDPFDEQQFNVTLSVPIVDWGRRKSELKLIQNAKDRTQIQYDQDVFGLTQAVDIRAARLSQILRQLKTQDAILMKSQERFKISNDRYVLGDIDITNLTISQQENNQAQRNYIQLLRDFWVSYYELRALTGFDVINNSKITY